MQSTRGQNIINEWVAPVRNALESDSKKITFALRKNEVNNFVTQISEESTNIYSGIYC
jgi:hypothetical protein